MRIYRQALTGGYINLARSDRRVSLDTLFEEERRFLKFEALLGNSYLLSDNQTVDSRLVSLLFD